VGWPGLRDLLQGLLAEVIPVSVWFCGVLGLLLFWLGRGCRCLLCGAFSRVGVFHYASCRYFNGLDELVSEVHILQEWRI